MKEVGYGVITDIAGLDNFNSKIKFHMKGIKHEDQ
jgi:hypothetical protein